MSPSILVYEDTHVDSAFGVLAAGKDLLSLDGAAWVKKNFMRALFKGLVIVLSTFSDQFCEPTAW